MRSTVLTVAFASYTIAMLAWLVLVGQGAQLERDVGERFVRLSGWPTTVAFVGLVWTALLVGAVVAALRARRAARAGSLATITVLAAAVTVFVPAWFRDLGYFGISTSEFLDGFFLLLGGILPGGQATLGLRITCAALVTLTFAAALSASLHYGLARPDSGPGEREHE